MSLADRLQAKLVTGPLEFPLGGGVLHWDALALGRVLRRASRFAFGDDVAACVAAVANSKPASLIDASVLARPPFPDTWIEGRIGAGGGVVGFLLTGGRAALFVRTPDDDVAACFLSVSLDYGAVRTRFEEFREGGESDLVSALRRTSAGPLIKSDVENDPFLTNGPKLGRLDRIAIAAFGALVSKNVFAPGFSWKKLPLSADFATWGPSHRDLFSRHRSRAIANQVQLMAALAVLNSRNLVAAEPVEFGAALQRKRARRGKLPLLSYHEVRIAPSRVQSRRAALNSGDGTRAHLVRGHFKVRKSGIYWWSPFVRGEARRGIVTKDYVVTDGPGAVDG